MTIADPDRRTSTNCWVRLQPPLRCCETLLTYPAGNDPELDPDRPADPPTKAIDKPVQRHGKRDGTDAPRPAPERFGNQTRTKPDNSNEGGTSSHHSHSRLDTAKIALDMQRLIAQ